MGLSARVQTNRQPDVLETGTNVFIPLPCPPEPRLDVFAALLLARPLPHEPLDTRNGFNALQRSRDILQDVFSSLNGRTQTRLVRLEFFELRREEGRFRTAFCSSPVQEQKMRHIVGQYLYRHQLR